MYKIEIKTTKEDLSKVQEIMDALKIGRIGNKRGYMTLYSPDVRIITYVETKKAVNAMNRLRQGFGQCPAVILTPVPEK